MLRGVFGATIAACYGLAAAPLVKVIAPDPSLNGIAMSAPGDPSFDAAVASIIPADQAQLFAPILPYSILVRNTTGRPLIGLCVAFKITTPDGHSSMMLHRFDQLLPQAKPVLAPGNLLLVAIERGYTVASGKQLLAKPVPADRLDFYIQAQEIDITVDSALYDDGTFVGPDRYHMLVYYNAQLSAHHDIAVGILQAKAAGDAALQDYLAKTAALDRGPGSPFSDEYQYPHAMASEARGLLNRLSRRGSTEVYAAAADSIATGDGFAIHR